MAIRVNRKRVAEALRAKRGQRSLRAIAPEVGGSHSTLSRIESGSDPDLVDFEMILSWLGGNYSDYFIVDQNDHDPLSVQLRAMQGMSAETANALMDVIRAVYQQILVETGNEEKA
jgi:transcriptional regulator with XRE-family HTH domain